MSYYLTTDNDYLMIGKQDICRLVQTITGLMIAIEIRPAKSNLGSESTDTIFTETHGTICQCLFSKSIPREMCSGLTWALFCAPTPDRKTTFRAEFLRSFEYLHGGDMLQTSSSSGRTDFRLTCRYEPSRSTYIPALDNGCLPTPHRR